MYYEGPSYPLRHPQDISYCDNQSCPFTDCARHLDQLKSVQDEPYIVSMSHFCGVCRKYISWLVDKLDEESGGQWGRSLYDLRSYYDKEEGACGTSKS